LRIALKSVRILLRHGNKRSPCSAFQQNPGISGRDRSAAVGGSRELAAFSGNDVAEPKTALHFSSKPSSEGSTMMIGLPTGRP
jgi:hypothetical protein